MLCDIVVVVLVVIQCIIIGPGINHRASSYTFVIFSVTVAVVVRETIVVVQCNAFRVGCCRAVCTSAIVYHKWNNTP